MTIVDTAQLKVVERLPGWRGRVFNSPSMTFVHYEFDAGSSIHEHSHEQEEVWNVIEADRMGYHIITAPADILKKLPALGSKTAEDLSLEGVKAFRNDTLAAGLSLKAGNVRRTAAE